MQINLLLDPLLHDFAHALLHVDQGLLFQVADSEAISENGFAVKLLVLAGQDAQQRGLAGSVEADHADLGAVKIGEGDLFKDRFLVVILADPDHGIDDFVGLVAHGSLLLIAVACDAGIDAIRTQRRGKILALVCCTGPNTMDPPGRTSKISETQQFSLNGLQRFSRAKRSSAGSGRSAGDPEPGPGGTGSGSPMRWLSDQGRSIRIDEVKRLSGWLIFRTGMKKTVVGNSAIE